MNLTLTNLIKKSVWDMSICMGIKIKIENIIYR